MKLTNIFRRKQNCSGQVPQSHNEWSALTSDAEVLQIMKGIHINITSSLPNTNSFQYSFVEAETEFVRREIENLLMKSHCSPKTCAWGTYIIHLCKAQNRW